MLPAIVNTINLERTNVVFEHDLKHYIEHVHGQIPFLKNDEGSKGKAKLIDQLRDPYNITIRDCKLPSFILAQTLKESGFETKLITYCNGVHPYVLTPSMPNFPHSPIAQISFHPFESGFKIIRFAGSTIYWDQLNSQMATYMKMQIYSLDEEGIKKLDDNFENDPRPLTICSEVEA